MSVAVKKNVPTARIFRSREGRAVFWQAAGVFVVALYVFLLHLNNDGLWFQGDSPRHAANGLFWWDLLSQSPLHPIRFAFSYYARYPVIQPVAYPPLFYLLEGFAFFLFGASPYVAKVLVLTFAVGCGLYLSAWLRRWVAPEAGWGGLLLILQPGVIEWSNVVMLNIPSMTLGFAALYHTRRWLEARQDRKQLYLAVGFTVAAALTYFPGGVVIPIVFVWIIFHSGWHVLLQRRTWAVCAAATMVLIPFAILAKQWSPAQVYAVITPFRAEWHADLLLYYARNVTRLVFGIVLLSASAAVLSAIAERRFRRDVSLVLIWITVCYTVFTIISFRDIRYVILLVPATVILAVMGVSVVSRWLGSLLGMSPRSVFATLLLVLTVAHVVVAREVNVPRIQGFEEVAAFFERVAPAGRFLYDGDYDGVFSFYIRARDPNFDRGVVLGDKLVYSMRYSEGTVTDYVKSPDDVVTLLKTQCGCEWIIIEKQGAANRIASARYLRQAVTLPEFQLVKSFPIDAAPPTSVDIYRFLPSVTAPAQLELHFAGRTGETAVSANPVSR